MQVETDRLLLRKHRTEDFERFWGMITDPVAKRFTGGVTTLTYEQRFKVFCEACSEPFSQDHVEFAVLEKPSMLYIGYCGYRASEELGGYELFYGYCQDSWGKGYGFEAADTAVRFFFDQMGIDRLVAASDKENTATVKILDRLGFKPMGQINIDGLGVVDKGELQKRNYKESNMNRVNEIQRTIDRFYEIISGEAGEERNWDEFRSLFLSGDSSLAPMKFSSEKECVTQRFDVEAYIARLNSFLANNDFYEYGFNYEVKESGSIAQVYSEYEAKRRKEDSDVVKRGINLVQFVHDGQAWKIHSMLWQDK